MTQHHFQIVLLILALYVVNSTSKSIEKKEGLPILNQIISWCILGKVTLKSVFKLMQNFTYSWIIVFLEYSTGDCYSLILGQEKTVLLLVIRWVTFNTNKNMLAAK